MTYDHRVRVKEIMEELGLDIRNDLLVSNCSNIYLMGKHDQLKRDLELLKEYQETNERTE